MRLVIAILIAGAASLATADGQTVSVTVSPLYAIMQPNGSLRCSAIVSGSGNTNIIWQVNNASGGSAASGAITDRGVYTAPPTLPAPASVTITAVSSADPAASATATITLEAQPQTGGAFYVATTGSDSNPGTMTQPFLTIQHAATVAAAGDTVLVRGGVYNALVAPPKSGNATQGYIIFTAFPGETATIDGTGLAIPGGQWGLITLENASYIVVQGFELRNFSSTRRRDVPVGLYVFGAGSNIQIINTHIHHIITTAKTNPHQCGSNALGMAVYGSAAPESISNLVVSGNELNSLQTGCSESMSIDGNVDGFAVTSNRVHDNDNIGIDAIGFEKVSPNPEYDQARNGEIRGNTVYNITSYGNPDYGKQYSADGLYVDGGTEIVIEQNIIHNVDLGIEMASEHQGHVTSYVIARNNVVYRDNSNGISIGGYGARRGGSDHVAAVNNTLWDNDVKDTGSGEFQIQYNVTNSLFENNITYSSRQGLMVNDFTRNTQPPAQLDYNLYFSPLGEDDSLWVWNKVHDKGFVAYQAATGEDAHSLFADPHFVSLGDPPVLDIQPHSPAISAGTNLGVAVVGAVDFAGNKRVRAGAITIGAYQR